MNVRDSPGDRMKGKYENPFRITLPQRTNVIIRIDGKAFHTFTKGLPRPYYPPLAETMDRAAAYLCKNLMGAKFAYGQSDEYSFLLTDYDTLDTEMWFGGNVQKMASVSASMFTAVFNREWDDVLYASALAMFDARVFVVPSRTEVLNYFLWRQQDATRNSLSMLAQTHFSHRELQGKNSTDMHEMLHQKGINWANEPTVFKRGRVVRKLTVSGGASHWEVDPEIPVFNQDWAYLSDMIPEGE